MRLLHFAFCALVDFLSPAGTPRLPAAVVGAVLAVVEEAVLAEAEEADLEAEAECGFRGGGVGGFRGGGFAGRGSGGFRGGIGFRGITGASVGAIRIGAGATHTLTVTAIPFSTIAATRRMTTVPRITRPGVPGPAVINQYYPQGSQYAQQSPQYTQGYSQSSQTYPQSAPGYQQNYPQQSYPQSVQNNAMPQQAAPTSRSVGNQAFYRTPDFYLIAFTNHTIQAAVSFSVEGDTLRYTPREHGEKTAPLSTVDVRFSQQINRDRHVEFKMPQPATSTFVTTHL